MGANFVNSICEKMGPIFEKLLNARAGLKILTNYCIERKTLVKFEIPVEKMDYKGFWFLILDISGKEVAYRILEAYRFA